MAQIYDSTHSGQEVDQAVEAALTTIPAQLTQIGSKLGDLTQLQTTEKTNLVGAINEVKQATEGISSSAADTTYVDNQGLGSTNVQGALDIVANKVLTNLGGATVIFEDAESVVTGKYVNSSGGVLNSSTATLAVAYYAIPQGLSRIVITIPKTGANSTRPVNGAFSGTQTSGLKSLCGAGTNAAAEYTLLRDTFDAYSYLVINYNSANGEPTIYGVTQEVSLEGLVEESELEGVECQIEYTDADCIISGKYINSANGNEVSNTKFLCTDFIEIPKNEFKITTNYTLSAAALVAFYSQSKTYITYLSGSSTLSDYSYTAPSNAKYMRLTCKKGTSLSLSMQVDGAKALTLSVKKLLDEEEGSNESASILWVGNSFTDNATANLGSIMTNLGVTNVSVNKMVSGGSGFGHWNEVFSTTSYSATNVYGKALGTNATLENTLATRHIDIIVIQQVSSQAGNYANYVPNLANLINKIRLASLNKNIKIAVAMVWGTYQSSFANIVSATKQMLENHNYIDYVIPLGTALESARISSIAEGYNGFSYNEQIWHLADGFGEYLAGCAFYQYMCERFTHIPITNDTTTISVDGSLGELAVTAENRGLAHTAAINASILKYTPISLDS